MITTNIINLSQPSAYPTLVKQHLEAMAPKSGQALKAAQNLFFDAAAQLLNKPEGLEALYHHAHLFDESKVFAGGPWREPADLQIALVAGSLRGPGITPVVETLSELRMLAIATGKAPQASIPSAAACQFLDEVIARNLRYLFPTGGQTQEERSGEDRYRESHQRLMSLIVAERGLEPVLREVASEAEQILAQRPIITVHVRRMVERAWRLAQEKGIHTKDAKAIGHYLDAAHQPTPLTQKYGSLPDYRRALQKAGAKVLAREAEAFGKSMMATGMVAPAHAVLVRQLLKSAPDLLPKALATDEAGSVEVEQNQELVHQCIAASVFPSTSQCLYGLSQALNRTLFSRPEVAAGLDRLISLEVREDVAANLLANRNEDEEVTAAGVLLAGAIAVLGQPLGIGQGLNPTCQSARGMSLWAQHDPAHLLKLLVSGARDGRIQMLFHGHLIRSDELPVGVATTLDLDLDPVSIVLVPHLDRLYSELMRRSALRLEDAHKWVNTALYGRFVPYDLATAFADIGQTTIADFTGFVRCFFATHHPEYNGGLRLMYPNPVGLVITNFQGRYLGPHAVSIQRIETDPEGEMRVYFYNPNNEGRQDWGQGVVAAVAGHGEVPGESSLPFEDFAARLYAFHFNPNEQGDLTAVPGEALARVANAARKSWGGRFIWLEPSPLGTAGSRV